MLVQIKYIVKNSNFPICQFPSRFSEPQRVYAIEKKINMEQEVIQKKLRSHLTSLSSIMTVKYCHHSHINLLNSHVLSSKFTVLRLTPSLWCVSLNSKPPECSWCYYLESASSLDFGAFHLINPYEGDADAEGTDGTVLLGPAAAAIRRHVAPHRDALSPATPLAVVRGEGPARAVRGLEHRGGAPLPVHREARRRLGRAPREPPGERVKDEKEER